MSVVQTIEQLPTLSDLERRIESGLSHAADAEHALQEIESRELWRGRYPSFGDYCLIRWGLGRNHLTSLQQALPERWRQTTLLDFQGEVHERDVDNLPLERAVGEDEDEDSEQERLTPGEELDQARAQGGTQAVVEHVQEEERQLLEDAAARKTRQDQEDRQERLSKAITRIKAAIRALRDIDDTLVDELQDILNRVGKIE